jgi:hypothetical protein
MIAKGAKTWKDRTFLKDPADRNGSRRLLEDPGLSWRAWREAGSCLS